MLRPQQLRILPHFWREPAPVFHERKLEIMRTSEPTNFLLNGMSDLAYWKQPWRSKVFG